MRRPLALIAALGAVFFFATACKNLGPTPVPYSCESGTSLEVQYPTDQTAFVYYDGKRHRLTRVISDSGTRFSDANTEWHTQGSGPGSTGILSRIEGGEVQTPPIDTCTEGN